MRRLLGFALSLASVGFVASSAEATAKPAVAATTTVMSNAAAPQWNRRRQARRNNRRVRVVTQVRTVRRGRAVYRETYQTRYLPNGRTTTRLISRVRIR